MSNGENKNRRNNSEIVIPKWAVTALVVAWSSFVVLFLPWAIWMTSNQYEQSATMREVQVRLEFIDKSTAMIELLKREISDLNLEIRTLNQKIEALENRLQTNP